MMSAAKPSRTTATKPFRPIATWLLRAATSMVTTAMFMAISRATVMAIVVTATAAAHAASFDCNKARSKLNRMICADAALSALDSQVWDTFGAHLKTLSPAQLAHVRERHLIWRRQRGWFDETIADITADYRLHLAWLSHPLLRLEGRYESSDGHAISVELDLAAQDRLSVLGEVNTREPFSWGMPEPDETPNRVVRAPAAPGSRPSLALVERALRLNPVFLGHPPGPVQGCEIEIHFGVDALSLVQSGSCGSTISGLYRRSAPPAPVWTNRR